MVRAMQPNLAQSGQSTQSSPQPPGAPPRRRIQAQYRPGSVVPLSLRRRSGRTVGQRNLEAALRAAPPATPVLRPASPLGENADTINVRFVLPAAAFENPGGYDKKMLDIPIIRDDLSDDEAFEASVDDDDGAALPRTAHCPITLAPFFRPVVAPDGHTYEKRAIRKWLSHSNTSPVTGACMSSGRLVHNHAMRAMLSELREQRRP